MPQKREVFEAKNLARVSQYILSKHKESVITIELILRLYKMLIDNIDDTIAGRFRQDNEFVRVGTYIASRPKDIYPMLS